jgi:hypothetical protein
LNSSLQGATITPVPLRGIPEFAFEKIKIFLLPIKIKISRM